MSAQDQSSKWTLPRRREAKRQLPGRRRLRCERGRAPWLLSPLSNAASKQGIVVRLLLSASERGHPPTARREFSSAQRACGGTGACATRQQADRDFSEGRARLG